MTPPSNFALRFIIEEDCKLVQTLNAQYVHAAADGGLEAKTKDALFDVLGRHFTGQSWPRSGGIAATRRFMTALHNAMVATGWKVDPLALA